MNRYLLTMMYDGSQFFGFQRQKNKKSVQKSLEQALSKIAKKEIVIKGAGRTDAGVHALVQTAHVDLEYNYEPEKLKKIINNNVDKYIRIINVKKVDERFHARFSVKEKTYLYEINLGDYNPFMENYMWQIDKNLNYKKIKKAAKMLEGPHDFSNFVSKKRDNCNMVINKIRIIRYYDNLYLEFKAKSFYRYMVRNLVGALIAVGQEKIELGVFNQMVNNEIDKKPITAPAQGLYIKDVKY